ncbi:MAG: segregation/condensation protein A [Elusimicrobiales bacterium]|nr:segregation/condensation protein A [Elusimicrobiales bacterium]
MGAIDVHLDVFEGPMDLLMHLIKKNNLDIYDIPISQITKEYLEYLDMMKEFNLVFAGEFLVMATTLMQIKAKMLLPAVAKAEAEGGPDPREDLINKLEEYQKYKKASEILEKNFLEYKDAFYRGSPVFANEDKFLDVDMFALLSAVKRAFGKVSEAQLIEGESFPIEPRIEKINTMLNNREWIFLDDIFLTETVRLGVITCFIAVLELIKQRAIIVVQDTNLGEVRIYRKPEPKESELDSNES